MKLSQKQLRQIIKEEVGAVTQATSKKRVPVKPGRSKTREMHLSGVKEIDKQAFQAYVDILIEDCQDKFYAMGDGHLRVVTSDGQTLNWTPNNSMRQWELDSSDDEVEKQHWKEYGF